MIFGLTVQVAFNISNNFFKNLINSKLVIYIFIKKYIVKILYLKIIYNFLCQFTLIN